MCMHARVRCDDVFTGGILSTWKTVLLLLIDTAFQYIWGKCSLCVLTAEIELRCSTSGTAQRTSDNCIDEELQTDESDGAETDEQLEQYERVLQRIWAKRVMRKCSNMFWDALFSGTLDKRGNPVGQATLIRF